MKEVGHKCEADVGAHVLHSPCRAALGKLRRHRDALRDDALAMLAATLPQTSFTVAVQAAAVRAREAIQSRRRSLGGRHERLFSDVGYGEKQAA